MKGTTLLVAVFGAGVTLGAISCFLAKPRHECPTLRTSLELNDPRQTAFIADRIKTLEWPNPDRTLVRFAVSGEATPNRNLTMKGMELLTIPDDHGHITLALVEIREKKARIAYVSEFNHSSFGQSLVTVACGIVDLGVQPAP